MEATTKDARAQRRPACMELAKSRCEVQFYATIWHFVAPPSKRLRVRNPAAWPGRG